jgi:hypothetical protein
MRGRAWLLFGVAVLALAYLVRYESRHSFYQSMFLSRYAADLTFTVGDGPLLFGPTSRFARPDRLPG